jgi:hypothetical protein
VGLEEEEEGLGGTLGVALVASRGAKGSWK